MMTIYAPVQVPFKVEPAETNDKASPEVLSKACAMDNTTNPMP
jgi:hypothetical protein